MSPKWLLKYKSEYMKMFILTFHVPHSQSWYLIILCTIRSFRLFLHLSWTNRTVQN